MAAWLRYVAAAEANDDWNVVADIVSKDKATIKLAAWSVVSKDRIPELAELPLALTMIAYFTTGTTTAVIKNKVTRTPAETFIDILQPQVAMAVALIVDEHEKVPQLDIATSSTTDVSSSPAVPLLNVAGMKVPKDLSQTLLMVAQSANLVTDYKEFFNQYGNFTNGYMAPASLSTSPSRLETALFSTQNSMATLGNWILDMLEQSNEKDGDSANLAICFNKVWTDLENLRVKALLGNKVVSTAQQVIQRGSLVTPQMQAVTQQNGGLSSYLIECLWCV